MTASDPVLVPDRTCGECRVCCTVFAIDDPDLQKEPGEPCAHLCAAGCGIYNSRPAACSTFHCAWRQTSIMPDAARPDRLGVMFYATGSPHPQSVFDNLSMVAVAVADPAALAQPLAQALIEQFSNSALPIHLRWRDEQVLAHPAADLADAIVNPTTTPHRHLVEAGRAWLARYAPLARAYAGDRVVLPPDD